jgi:molybdenum cofactor cytidylyltransferase
MKFGPVSLTEAEGAIIAHSLRSPTGVIKKGTRLTGADAEALSAAGVAEVIAARLEPGDIHEDEAAASIAGLLRGANVRLDAASTGRCNLYAERAGLFVVDRPAIDALNRLDPGVTVATLPEHHPVEAGRMVATVKIIPFAIPANVVARASALGVRPPLSVAAWRPLRIGLVATTTAGMKPSILDKTRHILEGRLRPAGASVLGEIRVPHEVEAAADALAALREKGADLLVAFGASAITDEGDVIPAALRRAGGAILHLGMPVDPGNLLLFGMLGGSPVLGAPGCARSPAENGFDWVLNRLLAGLEITPKDITGMGVGGLLMEIVSRPQPREPAGLPQANVAAVILAAGQARRMGGANKLTALFDGVPLVRKVAEQVIRSSANPVIVVTGHRAEAIHAALQGLEVRTVHNADYAAGLATSLRSGLAAVPQEAAGALVILADMPGVTSDGLDQLVEAFRRSEGPAIILPTFEGKRGNPVLWSRHFFPELMKITGDTGARHILGAHEAAIERVEMGPAAVTDVDTPEALAAAGGILP